MIFLIEYDRSTGTLSSLKSYSDAERVTAADARLDMELQRRREGVSREIVLLEAVSEAALRRTHQRYFSTLAEIIADSPALTVPH